MSEVISSFRSLRAGSHAFALLMLFICVIVHTMWLGKSLQLLCILPFGILCLPYVGGYCGLRESELCVFGKLCPVVFLVVCECSSILLQSVVMSYVDYGDDGQVVKW